MGDKAVLRALYEAAHILLTKYRGKTAIKSWGEKLLKSKGHHKAAVAVARRLAMAMWAMWRDGTEFELERAGRWMLNRRRAKPKSSSAPPTPN